MYRLLSNSLMTLSLVWLSAPAAMAQFLSSPIVRNDIGFANPQDSLLLEPGIYRALPAVYRVRVFGTAKLEYPERIEIDFEALKRDYESFRSEMNLPGDAPNDIVGWFQVALKAEKYLRPSEKRITSELPEGLLGMGSSYAIDRNGVLLTNWHVVGGKLNEPLESHTVCCYDIPSLNAMIERLSGNLGPWRGVGEDDEIVQATLLGWFGSLVKLTTHVSKIDVAVAYSKKSWLRQTSQELATSLALDLSGFDTRQPNYVPARVVAHGSLALDNDIAVLQIEGHILDALVCLPLSQPEKVRESAPVFSLGFPGFRYDIPNRISREYHSVNVQGGKIVWIPKNRPLNFRERFNVNAIIGPDHEKLLVVSAKIRCGSSGGPTILADGSLAGMNVAYVPVIGGDTNKQANNASPFVAKTMRELIEQSVEKDRRNVNLSVPISKILEFLKLHSIASDPGPSTGDWSEALAAYRANDFVTAEAKLRDILRRQYFTPFAGKFSEPSQSQRIASHYLEELHDLTLQRL